MARIPVSEGFAGAQDGFGHEEEMFAGGIQAQFARGGEDGVPMQDDDAFALGVREFFEAFAEFDFFADEEVGVEAADFSERRSFAKDEGAGGPVHDAADGVPEAGDGVAGGVSALEPDGAAAGEAAAGLDLRGDVIEERGAGVRIGIDEDEPIAGGGFGAAIARAGDLVDGLEDDGGAGSARDGGGGVGGVVIAHDEFGVPAAAGESGHGVADVAEGFAEEAFFVEGGDDDRDAHGYVYWMGT